MRVLVTGGRDFRDALAVNLAIQGLVKSKNLKKRELILINGAAAGLDTLVQDFCRRLGVACANVPANWDYYDKAAGMIRNEWMLLLQPEVLLSFPGGKGTEGMTRLAEEAGVEVIRCS